MAGLACARRLADAGHEVEVFDKARRPGGRLSTRRSDLGSFDHGAQYFTARDPGFVREVQRWRSRGKVAPWEGRIVVLKDEATVTDSAETERYVGVPTMSQLAREMSENIQVHVGSRIRRLSRTASQWWLISDIDATNGPYDGVVVAVPSRQAASLLEPSPDLARVAERTVMHPCWAVMAVPEQPLALDFDAAFVHDAPLGWVACNSSKPGRGGPERWVLHGAPAWAEAHLEDEPQSVARTLWRSFFESLGRPVVGARHLEAHRWRFALPEPSTLDDVCLYDSALRLGACGDWCGGARVEGAYLSGVALARRIVA
jgi:predicted NAD/FAD-dependent oxidoreductase